jgi:ABC-2 type transport system permease protein
MSYRRVRAICVKELHHITRDSRSLAMALGVPVLMLLLFGYGLSLDVDRIPTVIYDQDQTAEAALIRQFQVAILRSPRHGWEDYAAIEHDIDRSRISDGRGDSAQLLAGTRPAARRRYNFCWTAKAFNTASIALGYAEILVRSYRWNCGRWR